MELEVSVDNEQQFWTSTSLSSGFPALNLLAPRTNRFSFCADIQDIVSAPCSSEDLIDNALRAYLNLAAKYKGNQMFIYPDHKPQKANQSPRIPTEEYLQSEFEVARCSFKLLSSTIFVAHSDYVRRQMIYALLQVPLPIRFWERALIHTRDRKMTL